MAHDRENENSQQKGIVLKFKKRRFDGGSEVALIKAFEKQEARMQTRMLVKNEPVLLSPGGSQFAESRTESARFQPSPHLGTQPGMDPVLFGDNPVLEAVFLGPLELCVGLLGVMTATLGIMTFRHFKNPALTAQSRDVLQDCLRTVSKGFRDTVSGPGKVVRLVFHRA